MSNGSGITALSSNWDKIHISLGQTMKKSFFAIHNRGNPHFKHYKVCEGRGARFVVACLWHLFKTSLLLTCTKLHVSAERESLHPQGIISWLEKPISATQVVADTVAELALVTHKPRAASAYAVGHTRCAGACCSSVDLYLLHFRDLTERKCR